MFQCRRSNTTHSGRWPAICDRDKISATAESGSTYSTATFKEQAIKAITLPTEPPTERAYLIGVELKRGSARRVRSQDDTTDAMRVEDSLDELEQLADTGRPGSRRPGCAARRAFQSGDADRKGKTERNPRGKNRHPLRRVNLRRRTGSESAAGNRGSNSYRWRRARVGRRQGPRPYGAHPRHLRTARANARRRAPGRASPNTSIGSRVSRGCGHTWPGRPAAPPGAAAPAG